MLSLCLVSSEQLKMDEKDVKNRDNNRLIACFLMFKHVVYAEEDKIQEALEKSGDVDRAYKKFVADSMSKCRKTFSITYLDEVYIFFDINYTT